jgi:transcriptional regulator with XRE-family HTH domain
MKALISERTRRGWSRQGCATRAGLNGTEISRIENGKPRPWPKQEERQCKVFGKLDEELPKGIIIDTREVHSS